jgi:hypothetical protein
VAEVPAAEAEAPAEAPAEEATAVPDFMPEVLPATALANAANLSSAVSAVVQGPPEIVATQEVDVQAVAPTMVDDSADLPNAMPLGSVVAQLPTMAVPAGQAVQLVTTGDGIEPSIGAMPAGTSSYRPY